MHCMHACMMLQEDNDILKVVQVPCNEGRGLNQASHASIHICLHASDYPNTGQWHLKKDRVPEQLAADLRQSCLAGQTRQR